MGVNSLPKTVSRQRRGCDLNPGPTAPESSTLTTQATPVVYNKAIFQTLFLKSAQKCKSYSASLLRM